MKHFLRVTSACKADTLTTTDIPSLIPLQYNYTELDQHLRVTSACKVDILTATDIPSLIPHQFNYTENGLDQCLRVTSACTTDILTGTDIFHHCQFNYTELDQHLKLVIVYNRKMLFQFYNDEKFNNIAASSKNFIQSFYFVYLFRFALYRLL